MPLQEEIVEAAKKVVKDGDDMSIGELINLYRDKELFINPKYQRYFRWNDSQKTKFIESLLLGIPIPPIFVYTAGKKWEIIDGLQRMSTILEFVGQLRDPDDPDQKRILPPSVMNGTTLLPSLNNKKWEPLNDEDEDALTDEQRFDIRRVRIRVEILKKESDPNTKYELFQRLNTGGSSLSEQEIRTCTIIMINEDFYDWLEKLESFDPFEETIDQTERGEKRQKPMELVIRFLSYRYRPYKTKLDVHDYLDNTAMEMAKGTDFNKEREERSFKLTFTLLRDALGENAFRKWDGNRFTGGASLSAIEFISFGLSRFIDEYESLQPEDRNEKIANKVKGLWLNQTFRENSKAGVRGTTRLSNLLPLAETYFKP
jgi:uncharacterized protein with ParB-like and HNH nuclease domain